MSCCITGTYEKPCQVNLSVNVTYPATGCKDRATLTATSDPGCSFSWASGDSGATITTMTSGVYEVTATCGNCSMTRQATVIIEDCCMASVAIANNTQDCLYTLEYYSTQGVQNEGDVIPPQNNDLTVRYDGDVRVIKNCAGQGGSVVHTIPDVRPTISSMNMAYTTSPNPLQDGGFINTIRVYRNGFPVDIDLRTAIYTSAGFAQYRDQIRNLIEQSLVGSDYELSVVVTAAGIATINFRRKHTTGNWSGIHILDANGTSTYDGRNTATLLRTAANTGAPAQSPYTTPCGPIDSRWQVENLNVNGTYNIFAPTTPKAVVRLIPINTTPESRTCQEYILTANPSDCIQPSYSWTGPNNFTATTQTVTVGVRGTYTVRVACDGCGTTTSSITV